MYFLSHMLRVCHIIVIVKITNSYVLFAANLDDFRAIAKKFVPDQFANTLAQAISNISLKEALRNKEEDENYTNDKSDTREDDTDTNVYLKARNTGENTKTKLNFEELVKKVKKRLEKEFKNKQRTTSSSNTMVTVTTPRTVAPVIVTIKSTQRRLVPSKKPKVLVTQTTENTYIEAQPIEEVELRETDPPIVTPGRTVKKVRGLIMSNIQPSAIDEYDTERSAPAPVKLSMVNKQVIKQIKKVKNLPKAAKIQPPKVDNAPITDTMSFEKKLLSKKDSYEDYVTPEREENVYISKERETIVNKETRYKIKKNLPDFDNIDTNYKQSIKVKTMKEVNNPEEVEMEQDTTTSTPDDMYYEETVKTIGSEEIQARTENLWFDFNDVNNNSKVMAGDYNEPKKMKIGTMFPTRARFTIYTPEYIRKTTSGAEKYNFDEPIPEQDRVRENLKFFGDPVSKVNKKVRLF